MIKRTAVLLNQLNDATSTRSWLCFMLLSLIVVFTHGLSYSLSDLESSTGFAQSAWLYFLFFLLLVNLTTGVFCLPSTRSFFSTFRDQFGINQLLDIVERYFFVLLITSTVGCFIHWNAKLQLVDGSFNGCWSELRSAWLDVSSRNAMSISDRIQSMLGHLLSSPLYIGLLVSSASIAKYGICKRNTLYFISFCVLGYVYSLAIVSRSVVLLLLIIVVLGCVLPYIFNGMSFSKWARRLLIIGGLFAVGSFLVAIALFSNNVDCASSDVQKKNAASEAIYYENGFFDELPIERSPHPTYLQEKLRDWCSACNSVFIYLNHGFYNYAMVLQTDRRGDGVLFKFSKYWAQRLHLIEGGTTTPRPRAYGQGGVTLPGAAYHDYGVTGLILTAIGEGFLLMLSVFLMRQGRWIALVGLAIYAGSGITLTTSGLFVGPDLLGFPFAIFSILVWGGVSLILASSSYTKTLRQTAHHA